MVVLVGACGVHLARSRSLNSAGRTVLEADNESTRGRSS